MINKTLEIINKLYIQKGSPSFESLQEKKPELYQKQEAIFNKKTITEKDLKEYEGVWRILLK